MDIIATSLEALLQRATNGTNQGPDNAAIDAFCGLVIKEPDSVNVAAKLIVAKAHSMQEWEALQALLVLENCMKRCGPRFQSEVGTFRFLNELIKLVSPKFLGEHTPEPVKRRVLELMHTWTIHHPKESKIKEAYDMLKKQGVVKEEPPAEPVRSSLGSRPSILQDEEKSQLLQKLLQSKNPEDIQAANRLIKNLVKEDERRIEEKWRNTLELETVVNNCQLLKEMLDNYGPGSSEQDLELIKELHSTCQNLRPVMFKLANSSGDPAFCSEVLLANDELGEVFTKYNQVVKGGRGGKTDDLRQTTSGNSSIFLPESASSRPVQSLLDLSPSPMESSAPSISANTQQMPDLGTGLRLESQVVPDLVPLSNKSESKTSISSAAAGPPPAENLLTLDEVFTAPTMSSVPLASNSFSNNNNNNNNNNNSQPSSASGVETNSIIISSNNKKTKAFEELDLLSKTLLQQSLHDSKPAPAKQGKVTMNQLAEAGASCPPDSQITDLCLLDCGPEPTLTTASNGVLHDPPPDDSLLDSNSLAVSGSPQPAPASPKSEPESIAVGASEPKPTLSAHGTPARLTDVTVSLDSISPSSVPPYTVLDEKNGLTVVLRLAKDSPRPDVSVFVLTATSKNQAPLSNFLFQPVVPKGCRLRLQTPSSTCLPAHNPFLPPAAITQVMLIASSDKQPIKLKFVISYTADEETFTEMGEVDEFPLQDAS